MRPPSMRHEQERQHHQRDYRRSELGIAEVTDEGRHLRHEPLPVTGTPVAAASCPVIMMSATPDR